MRSTGMPDDPIGALRERVRALESGGAVPAPTLPFGIAALDGALPGGGLALGVLHEVMAAAADEEDCAAPAAFAAAILGRLVRRLDRPVLWCLAAGDLYGPGLAAYGLAPDRLLLTRCRGEATLLRTMEEGLRCPALAAVAGEFGRLAPIVGRRLQLAAEAGGVTGIVLRRWRDGAAAARQRAMPSAAMTRWRVAAAPSRPTGEPGIGIPLWRVELLRCRGGGRPGAWIMEEADATGHVALAAALADRPDQPARRRA